MFFIESHRFALGILGPSPPPPIGGVAPYFVYACKMLVAYKNDAPNKATAESRELDSSSAGGGQEGGWG